MRRPYKFNTEQSHQLLDQLLAWRDETAPEGGKLNEAQKNYKASQALVFGGWLIEDLIGWAMDHSIGISLLGLDLESRRIGDADNHEPEKIGADLQSYDHSNVREALARLILIGGLIPDSARQPLGRALQALNLGEIQSLVRPIGVARWKGAYSLAYHRQIAVMHVFFRWGRKTHTKREAQEEVADALGVGVNTLRTWEIKWLPKLNPDIKELYQLAKRAGEIQRGIEQDPSFETDDRVAGHLANILLETLPLKAVAEQHRATERSARGRPRLRKEVS